MNDSVIKTFCGQARQMLEQGVELRMRKYGIAAEDAAPANADVVGDLPLSPVEREQRAALLQLQARLGEGDAALGHDRLCKRAAYTWFNRMVAIRFMELRDYLPSRVRMFSNPDGSFGSQAVSEALDLEIEGLDAGRVLQLKQASDDDELFRYLLLAQCQELSACIPDVFEPVDAAMGLLLPEKLPKNGSVVQAMVEGIPEEDWLAHVEILGWMYQYYNVEAKDEFFKSKAKATVDTLPVATQLFTPEWIVRYMVQNSLGRLWMLNNPQSGLRQQMEYYIEPDAEHEDFIHIDGPEHITLCDPACGSGHILVYAFDLLFAMYEERGYREREIPQLILENNLTGLEIDPRAAQIASLALAMCAREHDRRFFSRGVRANINVVASVDIAEDELPEKSALLGQPQLLEALTHLDEIGSLLNPTEDELAAVRSDVEIMANSAAAGDMFVASVAEKLQQARTTCELLAKRYDCVVANPPYMGSSSFSPFMSAWVKKNYPDVKSDLCTCFIERNLTLIKDDGITSLVTSDTCMYLSSFVTMREKLVKQNTILAFIDTRGSNAHPDVFDANAVWVLQRGNNPGYIGSYVKLNHRIGEKDAALVEAIQNPACGWFYRRDAQTFTQIPGTPIAYWASEGLLNAFANGRKIRDCFQATVKGIFTGDNNRFLRLWHEVPVSALGSGWTIYAKGGQFRKWYGNLDYVINWANNASELRSFEGSGLSASRHFGNPTFTWSKISSSLAAFRFNPNWVYFDDASPAFVMKEDDLPRKLLLLGLVNSNIIEDALTLIAPTLNYQTGDVGNLPVLNFEEDADDLRELVETNIGLSKTDWDSFETSWDFKRHPLL